LYNFLAKTCTISIPIMISKFHSTLDKFGSVLLASMKRSASSNNLERWYQQPWQPRIGTASNQHPRIGSAGNLGIHKSVPLASSIHQKVPLASSIHKNVPLTSSIHKKVPLASSNLFKVPLATYKGGRVPDTISTSTEQCTDSHVICMQVIEFFTDSGSAYD
jgi:hypothetical protein